MEQDFQNILERLKERAESCQPEMIQWRRDFHVHPELGWCEFRTASIVADHLRKTGWQVWTGPMVTPKTIRMGVPSEMELEEAWKKALDSGGIEEEMEPMKGGYTGVVGVLENGKGPVAAYRFDMDALPVQEEDRGQPYLSQNPGCMHACGHDAHTAMGLAMASLLYEFRDCWSGTVKLFFQPAEEGVRGGRAMAENGFLDDVTYLFGCHIFGREGRKEPQADVIPGACGSLATTKLDVVFHGQSAHAGSCPEKGRNVMLAAAAAIQNLYSIPRHSQGSSRINVGWLEAGSGRNIIADRAKMELEVRGATSEINEYMEHYAIQILQAAARMHGCTCSISRVGSAFSLESTDWLSEEVQKACREIGLVPTTFLHEHSDGSEDCSYLMEKVKEHGGEAAFLIMLNDTAGPGHSPGFDIREEVMVSGVKALMAAGLRVLQ